MSATAWSIDLLVRPLIVRTRRRHSSPERTEGLALRSPVSSWLLAIRSGSARATRNAASRAADALGARFVQLDVTDDASVTAAAETVGELDVLVNNAGISDGRVSPSEATADHMRTVYETNVFGPVRVLRAFIPLLEKSSAPVVVNVSSGVGSLHLASDPSSPWREA
jgi:NAD(P)-dependent dehydrogenase (short-subunit alcohol dehydrogenase family)